jgi:hypothetical protein
MAELGETNDPRQLVPGTPAGLATVVDSMRARANELERAGVGLSRIDTADGWSGPAGDTFRAKFKGQPGSWLQAGDAFLDAADALESFANTLAWAQGEASRAIAQWNAAQSVSAQAQDAYSRYQEHGGADPFQDPGEPGRSSARMLLDNARSNLKNAGDNAAKTVGSARDKAPEKQSFWSKVKHVGAEVTAHLENAGAEVVNALASAGNAMIHHPGDDALLLGGALLTDLSAGGEVLGAGLDLTGGGAIVGVPLNIVSAAGITAGVTMAGAGGADLMMHARGDDSTSPAGTDHTAGSGSGNGEPSNQPTAKDQAAALGYTRRIPPQKAPFDSHGQSVFFDGKNYLTRDVDQHNVSNGWKMFNRRGQRIGTYDENLNRVKD